MAHRRVVIWKRPDHRTSSSQCLWFHHLSYLNEHFLWTTGSGKALVDNFIRVDLVQLLSRLTMHTCHGSIICVTEIDSSHPGLSLHASTP